MPVRFVTKTKDTYEAAAGDGTSVLKATPDSLKVSSQCLKSDLLPKLKMEVIPLNALVSSPQSVRKTSKHQLARVVRSMRRFGVQHPILISADYEIIDGQTRVGAARKLGLKEIPCVVVDDLSEDEIRLLSIALNRIQERGEWDDQALKLEFAHLLEFEPDLTVTGFEAPEIDKLLVLDGLGSDEVDPLDKLGAMPDENAAAVTHTGDLWHLDKHRLLCGNARSTPDLEAVIGDRHIASVFTDPPFNVAVNGHVTSAKGKFDEFAEASGEMSDVEYEEFLTITISNMRKVLTAGGVLFLCIDWRHCEVLLRVLRDLYLELLNLCIWAKDTPGMGSSYCSQHELVVVAKKPGAPHLNNVELGKHGRNRSNVWRYPGATGGKKSNEDDFSLHPTVKPVRLVRDALLDATAMGDVVLDPFLGSGTTLLACELSKRICAGIEISPAYIDVAIARWQSLTGRDAIHAETGLTFNELQQLHGSGDLECAGEEEATGPDSPSIEEDF